MLVSSEMDSLLAVLAASVTTFAATNIDDVFLLTLFFARQVPTRRIIAGQYLGFAVIILASFLTARVALAIPSQWIRALGLLPLAIGIKDLFVHHRGKVREKSSRATYNLASIALITLSNGADNIGVYVPFFVVARSHLWLTLISYAVLLGFWCLVARWLGRHELVLRSVERWGHWLVPMIFIALGTYILIH